MNTSVSQKENDVIDVATGEVKAARAPACLQCLALGSCVAVILYDREHKIGGIAHVMLPSSSVKSDTRDRDALKYANNSIYELVRQMKELGSDGVFLTARLVGGALVIPDTSDIGEENIKSVHNTLEELGIKIEDEHVGGNAGRSVIFNIDTNELQINGKIAAVEKISVPTVDKKESSGKSLEDIPILEEKIAEQSKELADKKEELNNIRTATFNLLQDLEKERENLLESKAKNDAMLASIGDGFAVADEKGKLIFFNKTAEDILGGVANQNLPDTWQGEYGIFDPITFKPYPGDQMPLFLATKGQAVNKVQLFIKNQKMPEGKFITITANPILMNGKSVGGVAVFRDMTKEMQIDRAKTEFVSLASHQLRTPLTSINWYSEMLIGNEIRKNLEKEKEYIEKIHTGSQRMVKLVNTLLDASRIELGTLVIESKNVDIKEILKDVIAEQKPQIEEKKIKVINNLLGDLHMMATDPNLLHMIFQNLMSNSIKYTPLGGKIDISSSLPKDNTIEIIFADTGYGIPKKDQDKIFTKMFRADNIKEKGLDGTGLGLYMVRSVVASLGGDIMFESEEDKGTKFFITLPLKRDILKDNI